MGIHTLLILDTETTGLNPQKDKIIEIGAVLWSVDHLCTVATYSNLIHADDNPAENINRIPVAALKIWGVDLCDAFAGLLDLVAGRVDALVAHNATFDRSFFEAHGLDLAEHYHVPWICTMSQIEWPRASSSKSLLATALAHDVAVTDAHRALADCQILARLFARCAELGSDLQVMLTRALRPSSRYVAQVSYDDRDRAKTAGFTWNAPEAPKCWSRIVADEDAGKFDFKTKKIS